MARASTVAVVVPSPATSLVFDATWRTSCAPMFMKRSLNSMDLATVTPSCARRRSGGAAGARRWQRAKNTWRGARTGRGPAAAATLFPPAHLGDLGRAKGLVQQRVAALGPERHLRGERRRAVAGPPQATRTTTHSLAHGRGGAHARETAPALRPPACPRQPACASAPGGCGDGGAERGGSGKRAKTRTLSLTTCAQARHTHLGAEDDVLAAGKAPANGSRARGHTRAQHFQER
jgi:hypothetical protein